MQFLFNIFLPRGKQYRHDEALHDALHVQSLRTDRSQLYIRYLPATEKSTRAVLLLHPYLKEAGQYYLDSGHVSTYHLMDIDVFCLDFGGFGLSPYTSMAFEKDIAEALTYIRNNFSYTHTFLHGMSFGAAQLLNFLAFGTTDTHTAIIENCLDSSLHYYKVRNKKLYYTLKILYSLLPYSKHKQTYFKNIGHIQKETRLLLLYAAQDTLTTIHMGERLYHNASAHSTFCVLQGDHLNAINKDKENYRRQLSYFIVGDK